VVARAAEFHSSFRLIAVWPIITGDPNGAFGLLTVPLPEPPLVPEDGAVALVYTG
jgi:hypothetical protein